MTAEAQLITRVKRLLSASPAGFAMALHIRHVAPAILIQSYPKDWTETYSAAGMVMRDPTVLWGFDNTGAIDWKDLQDIDTDGIMAQAAEYGIKHGFTYAIDQGGSRSITSFARSDRAFAATEIDAITGDVDDLHDLTAQMTEFDAAVRTELRQLGVTFTLS